MGDAPLDIAGAVLRARRVADLSQRELADAVGVSQPTVVRWESGKGDPSLDDLQRTLALAGLRLALVDDDGALVRPVHRDSVRDNADRRFPAHLDVTPPDERPRNRGMAARYDRPPAKGWYALRPTRDRPRPKGATATTLGATTTPATTTTPARPPDHPTTTELELRGRMRRKAARWGLARGPDVASCTCPIECQESSVCPPDCPCRCEAGGFGQTLRVKP